jgi:hypothetical protein
MTTGDRIALACDFLFSGSHCGGPVLVVIICRACCHGKATFAGQHLIEATIDHYADYEYIAGLVLLCLSILTDLH